MKTHISELQNGLKVVLIDTKAFPSVTSLLLVGAGSRYENLKNNGIAHFFEHMAFKGSKKYPDAFILSSIIESLGGVFNAFTSKDYTGYYVKSPVQHVEQVVDVLADMILQPILDKEELEREKDVIIQEINMYEDTPGRRIFDLYEQLLYPKQPLGYDITGSAKTVSSFTQQTFKDYISSLYHPNNAVLIIAGGLTSDSSDKKLTSLEDYVQLAKSKFNTWKKGEAVGYEKVQEKQTKPAFMLTYKKSEQAHMCIGYRTFSRFDDDRYALAVLGAILGRGMSSRLFTEIRNKRGLCYSIGTYDEYYDDAGNMLTYAGVSTDVEKVKMTIELTLKEYEKIKKTDVEKEELDRAKELIIGRLILSLEDTFNVANMFGQDILHEKKITPIEEVKEKINAVTSADIKKIAHRIFKRDQLNVALIGPFKDKSIFEALL